MRTWRRRIEDQRSGVPGDDAGASVPEEGARAVDRRRFMALLGGGAAGVVLAPRTSMAGPPRHARERRTRVAFRLSTRGHRVCGACKAHAANRYYRTIRAADTDRAHGGCNCAIVPHPLHVGVYNRYFATGDVWDVRWPQRRVAKGG